MADLCRKMAVWGLFLAVFGLFFFGFAQVYAPEQK